MAQSTDLRHQVVPQPVERTPGKPSPGLGSKIKHAFKSSFFWSYERGSWQYDIIVVLILAFIFLTPRAWFQQDPTLGMVDLRHFQGVVEVSHEKTEHTYMVDARLIQARAPLSPEDSVRDILQEGLHKQYHVVSVQPVQDSNGVTLSYRVVAQE